MKAEQSELDVSLITKKIVRKVRRTIQSAFLCCVPTELMFTWTKRLSQKRHYPVVLMYHRITEPTDTPFKVSPATFQRQCKLLKRLGYGFWFEKDWKETDEMAILITCDDGYQNNYTEMLPILQKLNVRASINVIADELLDKTDGRMISIPQAKKLLESGLVDIESHTCRHSVLTEVDDEQARDEIVRSKTALTEKLGFVPEALVYPTNAYNEQVVGMASEHYRLCFAGAFDTFDKTTPVRYRIPRIAIYETTTERELAKQMLSYTAQSVRLVKQS